MMKDNLKIGWRRIVRNKGYSAINITGLAIGLTVALFIGLFILATRLDQLEIIPIFLGFLTYKAALIIYTLRITFLPDSR